MGHRRAPSILRLLAARHSRRFNEIREAQDIEPKT